jgi:DNA polymerase elongation subunit (family B)
LFSQTTIGWILDVRKDYVSNIIVILIKLIDGKVISFNQKINERTFYILPKSRSAGEDLLQQLSRQDQLIKQVFWDKKYIDLHDKNKTHLISISLANSQKAERQDFRLLIQKLNHDSRVKALYNIDLSEVMEFIYTKLKIPANSKVKIEYDKDRLISIKKIDDSQEITPPPFSTVYIEISNRNTSTDQDNNEPIELIVRTDGQAPTTKFVIDGLSNPSFNSYIEEKNPDIIIFCGDYDLFHSLKDESFADSSEYKVIIHSRSSMDDIEFLDLVEKARFSYLPLKSASKYGMMRLIDSRITYELIQREFVIPTRLETISKHHEQIRTLEDIIEVDKAGMLISPEIGLHENVVVLDFNDEYANLIKNHNISYEILSDSQNQMAILPSIVNELVRRRVYLKRLLKANLDHENQFYCQMRLEIQQCACL